MIIQTKIYLAGPMQGYKDFNFPAFHAYAKKLREQGYFVFSPAEADEKRHGVDALKSETGDVAQATANGGFSLREALYEDTKFICLEAEAIAMMPGWELSKGAQAEWALARALSLKIIYLT